MLASSERTISSEKPTPRFASLCIMASLRLGVINVMGKGHRYQYALSPGGNGQGGNFAADKWLESSRTGRGLSRRRASSFLKDFSHE